MAKLLEVVDLSKTFVLRILNEKTIHALDRVSFEVEEGESVALTGKSGSGKSTLMKCLYRTYLSTSGHIYYDTADHERVDVASIGEHAVLRLRAAEITYCSQFLQVIPRIPALDVVASKLIARGIPPEEALARTRECFARLCLPSDLWDAFPSTFSGGEQQRVNIARAIISRPRLLLVDEPTASLDQSTKDAVVDMVLDLKRTGTSVVLITHDEHTLRRMADRRLLLEDGRLLQTVFA